MQMYVYAFICKCMYMYTCVCEVICIGKYMYVYVCICICMYMYMSELCLQVPLYLHNLIIFLAVASNEVLRCKEGEVACKLVVEERLVVIASVAVGLVKALSAVFIPVLLLATPHAALKRHQRRDGHDNEWSLGIYVFCRKR